MFNKLRQYIALACLLLVSTAAFAAKPTAERIVSQAVEKIKATPSVKSEFTAQSGNNVTKGSITVSKDMFKITSPEASTWYDGKNMWTLSTATNEVNLSEPSAEELAEINPLSFISTLQSDFKPRLLKSPAGTDCVEFTLKKPGQYNISKAVITFDAASHFPTKMTLTVDGHVITVTVNKFISGKSLPASDFKFNKTQYPAAEIIDLR